MGTGTVTPFRIGKCMLRPACWSVPIPEGITRNGVNDMAIPSNARFYIWIGFCRLEVYVIQIHPASRYILCTVKGMPNVGYCDVSDVKVEFI